MASAIDLSDYCKFCLHCGWNDPDYGCTSPSGEDLWQCPMYIHYHPEEVEDFNKEIGNGSTIKI